MFHIERTLAMIKPDAVERGLVGRIIKRFEDAGFKIVGLKMVQADEVKALSHYDESIAGKHGEHIRRYNMDFLVSGPVVAMVIEGVDAIENVRKFCGTTEPKSAVPGTIRGDYSHMSYSYGDYKKHVVKNIIHASENQEYADKEIALWFNKDELMDYQSVHEKHTR